MFSPRLFMLAPSGFSCCPKETAPNGLFILDEIVTAPLSGSIGPSSSFESNASSSFWNFAYLPRKRSHILSVAPLRCFATMICAKPRKSLPDFSSLKIR